MLKKKIVLSVIAVALLSSSLYAKKDENEHEKFNKERYERVDDKHHKQKYENQKELPKGLEKKLQKDGTLPPGWQKKVAKGQVLDQRVLKSGRLLNTKNYPYIKNSEIYQVEDRIFRVAQDTKMILEIFK